MNATAFNTKISEVANKIPDHTKYIPIHEYNKLTTDNFKERLKQVDLVSKSEFIDKLISHTFFLGDGSSDGSQNTFFYQHLIH